MSKTENFTPNEPSNNLLGISDKNVLYSLEKEGFTKLYQEFIPNLPVDVYFSPVLVLRMHESVFANLYDWAGKWRNVEVMVGAHLPPSFAEVPSLMAQWANELNFRISKIDSLDDFISMLAWMHHRFVYIHPFNDGNGRTSRAITDLIAIIHGFKGVDLYERENNNKRIAYIHSLREADNYNYAPLETLIQLGLLV